MAEILKRQFRSFLWAGVLPFPLLAGLFLAMILRLGWQNFSESVRPYGLAHMIYQASLGLVIVCTLSCELWLLSQPQCAYFVTDLVGWALQLVGFVGMAIYAMVIDGE
jgi:hypothetical protein